MPNTASKLRVLIATTNGPVEVLLLTEEDAAIGRCVACIGGTTETADIAAAYHAFVVRPTGVIESRFGHSCYRLDVSGRIDAGSSWQLGVLAAHGLLAAGRLAQENDTADAVLWATGSVRPVDLTVGAVSHVPEKIANSLDRLKRERDAGRRVLLALPSANAAEMPPKLASELAALGIETVALAHVEALFGALATKLPDAPHKASVPTPARTAAAQALPRSATASRQRLAWGAAVAVALVGMMAGAAVLLERNGESAVPLQPKSAPAEPSTVPEPGPRTASRSSPPLAPQSAPAPQPAPQPVELVPELVPFISAHDRLRIRDEYMTAPDYKALATSLLMTSFVSGHPSQEAADKAAMEACEKVNGPPRSTGPQMQRVCDLYASGNAVVTRRNRPPMPPTPWVVHNATTERPFVAADIPMVPAISRERAAKNYKTYPRSKAYVISTTGTAYLTSGQSSPDDVVRRTLERCGYESSAPCMVVAIDDTFVIPVPTMAKAVGFYRPDSLTAVSPRLREEIARRLANATDGWNAVAVGAGGQVGIKVGAGSEQSAVDGATEDCASRDRDCRVVVIGPFLVEATSRVQAQPQKQGQDQGQPQAREPTPPSAPARVALVPEHVPFVTERDRTRIRDEYMTAADYKALAMNFLKIAFVTGQPTQEAADRAAMETCERQDSGSLAKSDTVCDLYASGNFVVTRRSQPPMPPEPWVVRNPSVERAFVATQLPMVPQNNQERAKSYPQTARSKAFVISATGLWWYTAGQASPDEAVRRTLERCGYTTGVACMAIAVDNTFVVPIPTLAKVVGFYRPGALFGVQAGARNEVARRLAGATDGWNAVAVGADGNAGIAAGAGSEQDAIEGALADCAKQDRDCRLAVLGPFLVEVADPGDSHAATP